MKTSIFFLLLSLFSLTGNLSAQEKDAGKIVTNYFAWIDAHNLTAVGDLLTEDFTATAPFSPVPFDKMGWKGVGQGFNTAFPDGKHELKDWFADGDKVSVRGIYQGTNSGPNMGNPATSNKVNVPFNAQFTLDGKGKIKSINTIFDLKLFETQLMAGINPNAAHEAAVQGILVAADAGDADKLVSYFSPEAKHYFSGAANTNDELKMRVKGFKAAFPDIQRTFEVVASDNGTVTLKGWVTGTNTGSFMGKPATGNKIKISALAVYKFDASGKVVEAWVEMDTAALMSQLQGGTSMSSQH